MSYFNEGGVQLDEAPPKLRVSHTDCKDIYDAIAKDKQCSLSVTITLPAKKILKGRNIAKCGAQVQRDYMNSVLFKVLGFKTFNYLFTYEFTKKGIIHTHGIIILNMHSSSTIKVLEDTFRLKFSTKCIDVRPTWNLENWKKYMFKEDNFNICQPTWNMDCELV